MLVQLALEADPDNALHHVNRSYAFFALDNFAASLADARRAVELDTSMFKVFIIFFGMGLGRGGRRKRLRFDYVVLKIAIFVIYI